MWFDDFEPVPPQFSFNASRDDPRLDHGPHRSEPTERCPLASDFHPFALRPDIDSGMMHFRGHDHAGLGFGRWQPDADDTLDTVLKTSLATDPPEGSGYDIIVTGSYPTGSGGGGGGGGRAGDPTSDTTAPPPLQEPPTCSCAGVTEGQRQEQATDAEVAEVLREILARANQKMEYGSLIWIDSNGAVQHTPLIPTPDERARFDYSALPTLPDGRTDFSVVVAMVHSHPEFITVNGVETRYFSPSLPDRLLYPWEGDWESFDSHTQLIASAGGDPAGFKQYVVGWDGNQFVIHEYDSADRGTTSSASGQDIDPNTEACTC